MFKGKNVLVAGGAGFLGANLVSRLVGEGARVRATLHNKPAVINNPAVEYLKCDLMKAEDCARAVKDMDYVFMCAAFSQGAAVIKSSPLALVNPNVIMNTLMLDAAYTAKAEKFVFISSSVVYPPSGDRLCKETEMLDGEPFDIYYGPAWMKRYAEILCRLYSEKLKNPMPCVVVRPSNIYGPYDNYDLATSHVMAATIRKVADRHNPIKVWGTGEDVRDLIYVDDFIDGLVLAATKLKGYDPVNIAYGKGYTVKQILGMLLEMEGAADSLAVEYDASKPSMIPIRLFDTAKAQSALGFRAKTTIEDGIRKSLEWYRKNIGEKA